MFFTVLKRQEAMMETLCVWAFVSAPSSNCYSKFISQYEGAFAKCVFEVSANTHTPATQQEHARLREARLSSGKTTKGACSKRCVFSWILNPNCANRFRIITSAIITIGQSDRHAPMALKTCAIDTAIKANTLTHTHGHRHTGCYISFANPRKTDKLRCAYCRS